MGSKQDKVVDILRKPTWYKMTAMFDQPAKRVAELGPDQDVLIRGVKYRATITCGNCGHAIKANLLSVENGKEDKLELTPELAICVVPTAILEEQGEALRHLLEANLRMPVLLLTSNVHLVKLKPISAGLAKEIMEKAAADDESAEAESESEGKLLTLISRQDEGPEEGESGQEGVPEG